MSPLPNTLGATVRRTKPVCALLATLSLLFVGCGGNESEAPRNGASSPHGSAAKKPSEGGPPTARGRGAGGGPGDRRGGRPGNTPERGVPVEVASTTRTSISQFFETHGALEAEREVDLVSRLAGPIVELKAEEGMMVRQGQLLARIDDREMRASLEVSKVRLEETDLAYERVKRLFGSELVSQETVDQALANYQSARGDFERLQVQLQYTEITAPFGGLIVSRYVKFAENLSINQALFRLSDFDPLLCPIQVPERELSRLRVGQPAQLRVEAWPDESFSAKILRISPVVNAETGTIKVTLEVEERTKLRPGMFASVFLEVETRENALVVPKAALALDALEDTIFVAVDGVAQRRTLELGFRNDDSMEVLEGLSEGEQVVIVGQDGLSEGTPIEILDSNALKRSSPGSAQGHSPGGQPPSEDSGDAQAPSPQRPGDSDTGPRRPRQREGANGEASSGGPSPERLEMMRQRMKERGLSEEQIEERIQKVRQQGGGRRP